MLGLVSYARKAIVSEAALLDSLDCPLLVWETRVEFAAGDEAWMGTHSRGRITRPQASDPGVIELRKAVGKVNPFSMGITVGRAENNDVVIADPSISRFHAYFRQDRNGWSLVDAESRNGTWMGPLKLAGSTPVPVLDRARLRLGEVDLLFFQPKSFARYLQERMQA